MKKDKLILRMFLTLVIVVSFTLSLDWGDVWCRVWDMVVSIILCIYIWIVEIEYKE